MDIDNPNQYYPYEDGGNGEEGLGSIDIKFEA